MAAFNINKFIIFFCGFIFIPALGISAEKIKTETSEKTSSSQNEASKRWDEYFKRKMFDPPEKFVVKGLNLIGSNASAGKIAIDLGSGVGHEVKLLLQKGYQVIAVDRDPKSFKYMLMQPEIQKNRARLKTVLSKFQALNFSTLPKADLIVSSFSLPFVGKSDFNTVWENVVSAIKPGGHIIINLFTPEFTYFDNKYHTHMIFHTREEALALFSGFKIIEFREVKSHSFLPGKKNNYYVIVAQKK